MKYIDIHTHMNLAQFDEDYDAAIKRAFAAGVGMFNVGTDKDTSARAVALLDEYPENLYATVGLHPLHASEESFDRSMYKALAECERVVAIGECGLDYSRGPSDGEVAKQIEAFEAQIALANELELPLMLHIRSGPRGNAYKDAQDILKKHAKVLGNSHFFAGSLNDAKAFWDMGYSTSFTGVLTFTHDYDEVVQAAPKGLIHAETDAPYVAPHPHRGKRNEAAYVIEVVKRQAELRGVPEDEWAAQLVSNAQKLFRI